MIEPGSSSDPAPASSWVEPSSDAPRIRNRAYLAGFAPLVLAIVLGLVSPKFFAPMLDTTVPQGGIVLGLWILGVAALLMIAGVLVMRAVPTTFGVAFGLIVFTFPSIFLVIIGPAICLIVQNVD